MKRIFTLLIAIVLTISVEAKATLPVIKLSPNGEKDRTAEVEKALEKLRKAGGGEIRFAEGDYHFASPTVVTERVSNHDTPPKRNVFVLLRDLKNIKLRSKGARFVCDGEGIAIALIDVEKVKIEGIVFDYKRPFYSIWTLKDGKLKSIDTEQYAYEVTDDGVIYSVGKGWRERQTIAEFFDGFDHRFLGQVWWDGKADKVFEGYRDGCIAMTRSPYRPNPCVFLYRANEVRFVSSGAYAAAGMGLLAQRSGELIFDKWKNHDKRPISLQADATHFSNCRGRVAVINSTFEGMVDDAINVHSTSLKIVEQPAKNEIVCQFMHGQSMGFEVFRPGERLRFIKGDTLEPGSVLTVSAVETLAVNRIKITLEKRVPKIYSVGDAVENADYQPAIVFKDNKVRNSSPRATLFTTPRKVICSGNLFENVAGQPIYFAGDARNWYESGASRDVVIKGNTFRNCGYKSGMGMIQIEPTVHDLNAQIEPYHQNICVENNVFENFTLPLVWARSCKNVVLKNNKIINGNDRMCLTKAEVTLQ